jgi:Asp-tRNA(Asn)/Glu-tRNA(Gln) amidotransferase B subunit
LTNINDLHTEIEQLLNETDEEAIEEVKEKYEPFDKNMKALLDSDDLDSYLEKYEEMNQKDEAVLKCYTLDTTEELKAYIQKNEVTLEALKAETVHVSCEALKFAIYDSEEEDEY